MEIKCIVATTAIVLGVAFSGIVLASGGAKKAESSSVACERGFHHNKHGNCVRNSSHHHRHYHHHYRGQVREGVPSNPDYSYNRTKEELRDKR